MKRDVKNLKVLLAVIAMLCAAAVMAESALAEQFANLLPIDTLKPVPGADRLP